MQKPQHHLLLLLLLCHRDKYRYFACMLRARFEENKNEKDMLKATQLLKAGEEEFWDKQHPQPYIFPDSPGGTSYERYECYKVTRLSFLHQCYFFIFKKLSNGFIQLNKNQV